MERKSEDGQNMLKELEFMTQTIHGKSGMGVEKRQEFKIIEWMAAVLTHSYIQ